MFIISAALALLISFLGAGTALAAEPPPGAAPVSFVFGSVEFRVSVEVGAVAVLQVAELTALTQGAQELALPLSLSGARVTSLSASCPWGAEGSRPVSLSHQFLAGDEVVVVIFGEPLARYQTCRLLLEYRTDSPPTLRIYDEDGERYGRLDFSPRTLAPVREATLMVQLPPGWSMVESQPPGRVQSGLRAATATWNLSALGPRDRRAFSLTMTSRVASSVDTSPFLLLGALLSSASLVSGVAIVSSRRNLGQLWRVKGTALGLLDELLMALRPSESLVLALKNLSRRKARALLTFVGIVLGAAILAAQAFSAALNYGKLGELGLAAHLYVMVGIALGVCAYCVATTMLTTVYERRGEVGVMKAVGMPSGWVMRSFLAESLFFGLLAGGAGAALGLLLVVRPYLVLHWPQDPTLILVAVNGGLAASLLILATARTRGSILLGVGLGPLAFGAIAATQVRLESKLPLSLEGAALTFGLSLGFIILVCLSAGVYPAWKAARLYPVEALR